MKKILSNILSGFAFFLFYAPALFSQSVDEKLLYTLTTYPGDVDSYSFAFDKNTGTYAYVYYITEDNKSFIISNNSISEKYDAVSAMDIKFDSQGNYYTVTTNYKEDYGIDNNFIISNGNVIKAYDMIEGYSAFVNETDEFVFIFQEDSLYKIGYYSPSAGFRQSDSYDLIKTIYKSFTGTEEELYGEEMFFKNPDGDRGFIGIKDNRAYIIFGSSVTPTDYSDIMEYSFTTDNYGNTAFIAKEGERFYTVNGNEFVTVGTREYDKFELVNPPIMFNQDNEPVYTMTDSVNQDLYISYVVTGNEIQQVYLGNSGTEKAPDFTGGIYDIKIDETGNLTYMAGHILDLPSETDYGYNARTYSISNNRAEDMGINVGLIRYGKNREMIYGAKENKYDELYQLYFRNNDGVRKINTISYDAYSDYGFTPDNKVYYIAENFSYDDEKNYKRSSYFLYLDDKIIAQPPGISFQSFNYSEFNPPSAIQFNSNGDYTYVTEEIIDTVNYIYSSHVWTNGKMIPFKSNIRSAGKAYNFISNLSYLDGRLFYIGNISKPGANNSYTTESEILIDNNPVGKVYNAISDLKHDPVLKTVTFRGARDRELYDVTVRLY